MTNQQSSVLIAILRETFPRSAGGIALELGIPAPSVRRTISQLKQQGYPIMSQTGEWGVEYKLGQFAGTSVV